MAHMSMPTASSSAQVESALAKFGQACSAAPTTTSPTDLAYKRFRESTMAEQIKRLCEEEDVAEKAAEDMAMTSSSGGNSSSSSNKRRKTATRGARSWSHEDFLARLKTFCYAQNWFAKPQAISPLACARFGWCNKGLNALFCHSCEADLVHDEASDASGAVLKASLTSAHQDTCGWKNQACDESIVFFPSTTTEANKEGLLARLSAILHIFVKLEEEKSSQGGGANGGGGGGDLEVELNVKLLSSAEMVQINLLDNKCAQDALNVLATLRAAIATAAATTATSAFSTSLSANAAAEAWASFFTAATSSPLLKALLALAVCGWSANDASSSISSHNDASNSSSSTTTTTTTTSGALSCGMCGRCVSLPLFLVPSSSSSAVSTSASATSPKILDCINQHRSFCPFTLRHEHAGLAGMCGWKQVLYSCAGLSATNIFAFSEEEVAEAKEFVFGAGGGKKGGVGVGSSEENESSSDELFRKIRSILDV